MKTSSILVPLLAASTYGFALSPTCLRTAKNGMNKWADYVQVFKAHICDQGCVMSYQSFDEVMKAQIRPAVQKILVHDFGRAEATEAETDKVVEILDEFAETAVEKCQKPDGAKPPTLNGKTSTKPNDGDICEDPSVGQNCWQKLKSSVPGIVWKHKSFLLSYTDDKTCKHVSDAIEGPELWATIEQVFDNFAASCPTRN